MSDTLFLHAFMTEVDRLRDVAEEAQNALPDATVRRIPCFLLPSLLELPADVDYCCPTGCGEHHTSFAHNADTAGETGGHAELGQGEAGAVHQVAPRET